MTRKSTSVFISYSHDSDPHRERVRTLADSLARDGCDCRLDLYKDSSEDWPTWMARQLTETDFVLCVVTETYERRFRDNELPDRGHGVGWEAGLIRRLLYKGKMHNDRVFPVCFIEPDRQHVPIELQGYDDFLVGDGVGYEILLRKILQRPLYPKPDIGTEPDLATRPATQLFPRPRGAKAATKRIAGSKLLDLGVTERFDELLGRDEERNLLEQAWHQYNPRILVFVAEGGVGKTSLVADWMLGFTKTNWQGVDAFFDWSFFSQGTRDQSTANSGEFFDSALRHFGETELADSAADVDTKATRLAEHVAGAHTLLVLDGVEPLQHPLNHGALVGRFKDTSVQILLKRLAQLPTAGGLCIVTSRVPVVDLNRFHGGTVQEILLDHLAEPAAAQLLFQAGARQAGNSTITPGDKELLAAARELGGHALAAQLLGGYLQQAHGGDIRKRDRVDWEKAFNDQQEGHAWAVMRSYQRWFEQHSLKGKQQLAVLRLLGLFDRPADTESLRALRKGNPIIGLTDTVSSIDDDDWNRILTSLAQEHRLISVVRSRGHITTVDTHPLVREYFANQLREKYPFSWIAGHRRLYDHLCNTAKHRPDTLEDLVPLYQAVTHGCKAGLHQQVCDDVYFDRITRGSEKYVVRILGAITADLGAVACFFVRPWDRIHENIRPSDKAWLFNEAAYRLRALGRMTEASQPMEAGLSIYLDQGDWKNASAAAGNLSELKLTLGEIATAIEFGEQSVKLADLSNDAFIRIYERTTCADALHQVGDRNRARLLFDEAKNLQGKAKPQYPHLYSLAAFRDFDLVLVGAERAAWKNSFSSGIDPASPQPVTLSRVCDTVIERVNQHRNSIHLHQPTLLDQALSSLLLARATLYKARLTATIDSASYEEALHSVAVYLNEALNGVSKLSAIYLLPRVLLTRAWQRCLVSDRAGSIEDLDEAWEIAERGSMPLYQVDILLTRARLFGLSNSDSAYPWDSWQQDLATAKTQIEEYGYGRRRDELSDAFLMYEPGVN